jgi:hypothetical protein
MNKTMVLFLIAALNCIAGEYHPLSGVEKKSLVDNYKAIKAAFAEKNYVSIQRFAPVMLSKFESVLMDPECRKLRPFYIEIESILGFVRYAVKIDSINAEASLYLARNDIESSLVAYDNLLTALQENDSENTIKFKKKFDTLVAIAEKKKSMATYSILTSLNHINREGLKGVRYEMMDQFDEKLAQLSASMNPDSLYKFQKNYSDIKPEMVMALLDRARGAMRQSLVRQPSIDGYSHYKSLFGDDKLIREALKRRCFRMAFAMETPDPLPVKDFVSIFPEDEQKIWKEFEDSLYQKWNAKPSEIAAKNYLRLFPEGRYSQNIYEMNKALNKNMPGELTVSEKQKK